MGSKGSTQVDAPDPIAMAQADARFNRIDQNTPTSNLQYSGADRNQLTQTLNPALQHSQNQSMMSDIMLNNMALGRQGDMKGGSLPSLTTGINPTAQQGFFGTPSNLQSGFDAPTPVTEVPDFIGDFQNANQFGGGYQMQDGRVVGPNSPGGGGSLEQQGAPIDSGGKVPPGSSPVQIPEPGQPAQQGAKGGQQAAQAQQQAAGQKGGQGAAPQEQGLGFGGSLGALINKNNFGLDPEGIDRGRSEQGAFDRQMSLMNPGFDQDQERLQQDLANRGIPRDSEAGRRELANFQRNKGETVGRVAQDAIGAGGQEVQRQQQAIGQLFGLGDQISQRDIQTQLQNANIAQSNRGTQFNELASLLGLNQVAQPGLQNFFAPGQVDTGGAFALNQQAQQNNANNAQAQKSGMLDAGVGLATAGILR